jgi:hypothetical protein
MSSLIRLLALPAFATAIALLAKPVQAQSPPWCAIMDNDGNTDCSYYTEQQCLQTVSGVGGVCIHNPGGSVPQPAPPLSSENAQGLLQLQQQDPGPPPGLDGSAAQAPPNN